MKKVIFIILFLVIYLLPVTIKAAETLEKQISRLLHEGANAYQTSAYQTALEKWNKGLLISQNAKNKQAIGAFLVNIGLVYCNLGQYEKALSYYNQVLMIQREIGDRRYEDSLLINFGMVYCNLGQYEKALLYYKQALSICREAGDRKLEGRILGNIGVVYDDLGRYEKALSYYNQALVIKREAKERWDEGGTLINIGVAYWNLGQYEKALSYYNQALAIHKEIGDRNGEGSVFGNIGLVYDSLGQYEKALSHYKNALAIHEEIGDRNDEGSDMNNIGLVHWNLGQYKKALLYYNQALAIHREIGDRRSEGSNLGNIGLVYQNLGQYEKALSYYEQALAIDREIGDRRQEGSELANIGVVYSNQGQYEKALSYYEQALAIDREIGDRQGEASDLTNIGVEYWNMGQYKQALSYYEQALVIDREIGDRRGEGSDLCNIGAVYTNQGQYEKALSYCEQALAIHREIGSRQGEGSDLINIGVVYDDIGQYDKAREFFDESLKICMEVGAPESLWRAQCSLASVEVKLRKVKNAVSHYEQALDTIETIREVITEKETKTSFIQDKLFVYDELIELLQNLHQNQPDQGHDRKSLEIFERKQGRVFLEEMGRAGARNFAGIPDAVLKKENNLVGKLTALQSNRVKEGSKREKDRDMKRIRELERQIEGVKAEQQKHQETIKTEYPDYYALKYPKPAALKDIQKHVLKPGEMMLVYGVMKKHICLWVISKDRLEFYTIQIKEKYISDKVNNFRKALDTLSKAIKSKLPDFRVKQLARKSGKKLHQDAYELYELLVSKKAKPIISKAKILYIIPTSSLYGLPFEALVTQADEKGVRYLVEDHPIAYLSSASLLKIIRDSQARKKEKATQPLIAFANPVYGTKENPCIAMTRRTATDSSSFSEMRLRGYSDLMGGDFCELPATEEEVKEIRTILGASDDSLQLRKKASTSNVFKMNEAARLDDYRYIIFSCHGLLPGEVSQLTQPALLLSHPDPETGKQGFLTMADVFGIRLNANLVTLSACNTGRGDLQKGEGIIGLTRAFMYAGTPAVSVTLWSVESESAKTLSTGFYKNLKAGMSKAEALRQIKLRMIRGEEGELFKHPFFWAPTVIFGDAGKYRE